MYIFLFFCHFILFPQKKISLHFYFVCSFIQTKLMFIHTELPYTKIEWCHAFLSCWNLNISQKYTYTFWAENLIISNISNIAYGMCAEHKSWGLVQFPCIKCVRLTLELSNCSIRAMVSWFEILPFVYFCKKKCAFEILTWSHFGFSSRQYVLVYSFWFLC